MAETKIERVGDDAYEVIVNGQRVMSDLTMEQVIEYLRTPEELIHNEQDTDS